MKKQWSWKIIAAISTPLWFIGFRFVDFIVPEQEYIGFLFIIPSFVCALIAIDTLFDRYKSNLTLFRRGLWCIYVGIAVFLGGTLLGAAMHSSNPKIAAVVASTTVIILSLLKVAIILYFVRAIYSWFKTPTASKKVEKDSESKI